MIPIVILSLCNSLNPCASNPRAKKPLLNNSASSTFTHQWNRCQRFHFFLIARDHLKSRKRIHKKRQAPKQTTGFIKSRKRQMKLKKKTSRNWKFQSLSGQCQLKTQNNLAVQAIASESGSIFGFQISIQKEKLNRHPNDQ